jgi:hypothetical protein
MIHILYRHTENTSGVGKSRPKWFSYENSLNNILNTIENRDDVTFHLIYDGTYVDNDSRIHKVVEFKGGSDKASFFFTWEYAKQLKLEDKDLVYFCENDYLHVSDWVDKVLNLYETYNIPGYVSLYDHKDKYVSPMYSDLQSQIYVTNSSHWRTVPSTCGSFVVNKDILHQDYDVHTTFYSDHDKFIELGKTRNRIIITPMPSLSTHCEIEWLAPLINWEHVNSNFKS